MTPPADGWKMTDAEITDCYTPNVHMEDADLDRAIAEAAARKALAWASQYCEQLDLASYPDKRLWPSDIAAAIREAAK